MVTINKKDFGVSEMNEMYSFGGTIKWLFDKKSASSSKKASPFDLSGCVDKHGGIWKEEALLAEMGLGPTSLVEFRGDQKYSGLQNMGATCYVNSLLQSLYFIPEFTNLVLSLDSGADSRLRAFQTLWGQLAIGVRKTVNPEAFLTAFSIQMHLQEDATEFCTLLLNWLQEASLPVRSLFEGEQTYFTTCLSCSTVTDRVEKFLELRLDGLSLPSSSVDELLKAYLDAEEEIPGFHCQECNQHNCIAVRRTCISKYPKYLRIVLNRYSFSIEDGRVKNSIPVTIPLNSLLQYTCLSVLEHHSARASSGHYTAHLRDPSTAEWYMFDDSVVTASKNTDAASVLSNSAYMLVYGTLHNGALAQINPWLANEITLMNRAIETSNLEVETRRDEVQNRIKSRKELVNTFLTECRPDMACEDLVVVRADWLKTFVKGTDEGGIPASPVCEHGGLDPFEIYLGNVKYVPKSSFPKGSKLSMCLECSKRITDRLDLAELFSKQLALFHAVKYEHGETMEAVWVTGLPRNIAMLRLTTREAYFGKMITRRTELVEAVDISKGTVCKHNWLLPSVFTDPLIVLKPKNLVSSLVQLSEQISPCFGIPLITANHLHELKQDHHESCPDCTREAGSISGIRNDYKRQLPTVMKVVVPKFDVGKTFYVHLASWIGKLRTFLETGKRVGKSEESLLCEHGDLKINVLDDTSNSVVYLPEEEEQILTSVEFQNFLELNKPTPVGIISRDNSFILGTSPAICPLCCVSRETEEIVSVRVFHEPADKLLASGSNKSIRMKLHETTVMYRPGRSRLVGSTSGFGPNSTGLDAKLLLLDIGILASAPHVMESNAEGLERMNIYVHHPTMRGSLVKLRDETSVAELLRHFDEESSMNKIDTLFVEFIIDDCCERKSVKRKQPIANDKDAGLQGSVFRTAHVSTEGPSVVLD